MDGAAGNPPRGPTRAIVEANASGSEARVAALTPKNTASAELIPDARNALMKR